MMMINRIVVTVIVVHVYRVLHMPTTVILGRTTHNKQKENFINFTRGLYKTSSANVGTFLSFRFIPAKLLTCTMWKLINKQYYYWITRKTKNENKYLFTMPPHPPPQT